MSGDYVHLPWGFSPGKLEGSCSFHCRHHQKHCSGTRCAGSASSAGQASCLWSLRDGSRDPSVPAAVGNHTRLQPLNKTVLIKPNQEEQTGNTGALTFTVFIWYAQENGMVIFTCDSCCLGLLLGNNWETKVTQILQASMHIQICG